MRNEIYHYAPVEENPAGFSLNQRVVAVYQLAGFIHQTYRNHVDSPQGKPHWQYIKRGGVLTPVESSQSLEDVLQQLQEAEFVASVPGIPIVRLYLGLRTRTGTEVNKDDVVDYISGTLTGFTLTNGTGCFEGQQEAVRVISVASNETGKIWALAEDLRVRFDQDGVGLEINGLYHRVKGSALPAFAVATEEGVGK